MGANAFRLWLRYAKPAAAVLIVDEGAKSPHVEQGRSLLAVGVVRSKGSFSPGNAVELATPDRIAFAKGLASAGSDDLSGRPGGLEVVHRDRA